MGFFSWNCKGCGHPLLSLWAVNDVNHWMQQTTVLLSNGGVRHGKYDGYGSVDGDDIAAIGDPCVWHTTCWRKAGEPKFDGPSEYAEDQGYFFEDPAHDMPEPKNK